MEASPTRARPLLLALAAGIAFTGLSAPPSLALDFQLHTVSLEEDGFVHKHSCFKYDEHKNMMIDLPQGWSTTADADAITTSPPQAANTFIRLQRSPLAPSTPFRDDALATYRQRALAAIPAGAVNVRLVKETANPLPVFDWQDFEFEMTYDFFGATFHRSALFIDLDAQQQILTTVVADPATFDKVHAAAMDVLRSWCPTSPSY